MRTYKPKPKGLRGRMMRAARLRSDGKSLREIAQVLQVHHSTVAADLKKWDEEQAPIGATRDKKIAQTHVRRARMAGVPWEYISLAGIAERDEWTCGICKQPVPRQWLEDDRKLNPSLDHIVPIEHGGAHLPGNVQLAHFSCNLSKGCGHREPHHVQPLTLATFTSAALKVHALTARELRGEVRLEGLTAL